MKFFRSRRKDATGDDGSCAPNPSAHDAHTGTGGGPAAGDDLAFLPAARPAWGGREHGSSDSGLPSSFSKRAGGLLPAGLSAAGGDESEVPLPLVGASKLAGLFDDEDDGAALFAAPSAAPRPAAAPAAGTPAPPSASESRPSTAKGQGGILWSGSVRLFRLDDEGAEMQEVDAKEGRGNLFGAALRMPQETDSDVKLIVYSGVKKRVQLSTPVASLELQPPGGESVTFYDESWIYWALQLGVAAEASALFRLLVAAKALATGSTTVVQLQETCGDGEGAAVGRRLCLRVAAAGRQLREPEEELWQAEELLLLPEDCDERWGDGVGAAAAALCQGGSALVAVPPGLQAPVVRRGALAEDGVLLLDIEVISPATPASAAQAAEEPVDDEQQRRLSLTDRMARLARAGQPSGAVPPTLGAATESILPQAAPGAISAAEVRNGCVDRCAAEVPGGGSAWGSFEAPAAASRQSEVAHPGDRLGVTAEAPDPSLVGHPSAEIIRQYWAAVQESSAARPYAYLGALPVVPGLSRGAAPTTLGAWGPDAAVTAAPPSACPPLPSPGEAEPAFGGSAPLGSLRLCDLLAGVRAVVRAEATPEGWALERQKLERRAGLLEEQAEAARAHETRLRETHRAQVASLHAQLSEAQLLAHQLREQQLRSQSESQMRQWEQSAAQGSAEAELRQSRGEAQQLRLEVESLREALAAEQRRGQDGGGSSVAGEASGRGAEADAAALLRGQLQAMAEQHAADAISLCKSLLSVAYVGFVGALPLGPGALADAAGAAERAKRVCQQCGLAAEEELLRAQARLAVTGRAAALADQVDWELVERLAGAAGEPVLPDLRQQADGEDRCHGALGPASPTAEGAPQCPAERRPRAPAGAALPGLPGAEVLGAIAPQLGEALPEAGAQAPGRQGRVDEGGPGAGAEGAASTGDPRLEEVSPEHASGAAPLALAARLQGLFGEEASLEGPGAGVPPGGEAPPEPAAEGPPLGQAHQRFVGLFEDLGEAAAPPDEAPPAPADERPRAPSAGAEDSCAR